MRKFAFLSGLPRTGTTVLATLLSEHPSLHTTGTSYVRDFLLTVEHFTLGNSLYYDLQDPKSPAWGMMRGLLYGAYEQVEKEIVVDKNRGWASAIPILRKITGEDPRILAPVRPVPEIIASFILLSQKIGKNSKIEHEVRLTGIDSDSWSLSRLIWEKYISPSYRVFKTAYETDPECFLLLQYDEIVNKPEETSSIICTYLNTERWSPPTRGLVNPNPENDAAFGLPGLHTVRPELKRTSPPAEQILGEECYNFWVSQKLEFWANG